LSSKKELKELINLLGFDLNISEIGEVFQKYEKNGRFSICEFTKLIQSKVEIFSSIIFNMMRLNKWDFKVLFSTIIVNKEDQA
jgi:hypothetical protein